ncbi:MAG: hypothetical protein EOP86_15195 [Verrucomicrobiaceae bacterium]|nr:MAG: hypothetical protein EOP86_15195 [Verrucomicrobiaceae bacterium]
MKVPTAILLTLPLLLSVPHFCDVRPPHPDSNLNGPKQALEAARQFEMAVKYAEALERHEWFHENTLRIDPLMAGVRLSFALGDWVRLGKKYPPAMESLRRIRDLKTRAIRTGAQDE